jgi:hypothetical protein
VRQEEIFHLIMDERKRQGRRREDFEKESGNRTYGSMQQVLNNIGHTVGIKYLIEMLDVLDMQIVIEDKKANWGLDMRLRRMPKKLYLAERIESRERVISDGLYARVDMFETPEAVLQFYPKPCDVYEIHPQRLIRKHFDVTEHPFGTMYSYNDWVAPEYIKNRATHR